MINIETLLQLKQTPLHSSNRSWRYN